MALRHFDDEDPIFLAQVQRGITNFVKILTGKDIPVEYATSGDSMTDGEKVYIASNLKEDTIETHDGLGDAFVVLTNLAHLCGTTIDECIEMAYHEISQRKGKMENGTFVKNDN